MYLLNICYIFMKNENVFEGDISKSWVEYLFLFIMDHLELWKNISNFSPFLFLFKVRPWFAAVFAMLWLTWGAYFDFSICRCPGNPKANDIPIAYFLFLVICQQLMDSASCQGQIVVYRKRKFHALAKVSLF